MQYLATDESRKREKTFMIDVSGKEIDPHEATRRLGGHFAEHWHGIIALSNNECSELTRIYGGDIEKAALEHGRILAARIQRELGVKNAPMIAIHFESSGEEDGRWHYHFVSVDKANTMIFGRTGALQKAWDGETHPNRKPILDWKEHQAFLATRVELREVQKELRELARERYTSIRNGRSAGDKQAIRDAYGQREIALIQRRHALEVKGIDHRYASRGDLGSTAHKAELERSNNRRAAAMDRLANRGQNWHATRNVKYAAGRSISAAKRTTQRAVGRTGKKALEVLQKAADRVQATAEKGASPRQQRQRIPQEVLALKGVAQETALGAARTAFEVAKAAANTSAKLAVASAKASVKMTVGLAAAIPTGGASLGKASGEAGRDLAQGAQEAGKEMAKGAKNTAREAGRTALGSAKALGGAGLQVLPKEAQELVHGGLQAARTGAAVVRKAVTLDVSGAAMEAVTGGLKTAKHVTAATMEGSKRLPAVVRAPLQLAGKVPLVGQIAKAAEAVTDIAATASRGVDFEL